VKLLNGCNSVRDKKTSENVCMEYGLPFGFDGPMHPLGMHAGRYISNSCDPVHYMHTLSFERELSAFASHCLFRNYRILIAIKLDVRDTYLDHLSLSLKKLWTIHLSLIVA